MGKKDKSGETSGHHLGKRGDGQQSSPEGWKSTRDIDMPETATEVTGYPLGKRGKE